MATGVNSAVQNKALTPDRESSCYRGGIEDVIDLVNKAEKLIEKVGPKNALVQFMNPTSEFVKGDLYLFVLDPNGIVIAHGNAPQSIGNSALEAHDKNDYFFVKDILRKAFSQGSGWVQYDWFSPCTGEMSLKKVYFKRVGLFVVSAGYYDLLRI